MAELKRTIQLLVVVSLLSLEALAKPGTVEPVWPAATGEGARFPAGVGVGVTDETTQLVPTATPNIIAAGAVIESEDCDPATATIDPGELVTVALSLENTGDPATNVRATLQEGAGVLSPSGPQDYGPMNPGDPPVSRSFSFIADPQRACGDAINVMLVLEDGLGTVSFPFTLGGLSAAETSTFSTGNIALPIPDLSTIDVPIEVADTGVIDTVVARVRLNHTFDGDLEIRLVHPDGTAVLLADNRGGGGDNYGVGANDCSGTPTVFDDDAANPISFGPAPFAGTFRPEVPLATLDGKPIGGTWNLRIADTAGLDVGTVGCVSLVLTRRIPLCCPFTGGAPAIAPEPPAVVVAESCIPGNSAIDVDETVTVDLPLRNIGTAPTTNLVATLLPGGGVLAPSGPQTYGELSPLGNSLAVARPFTFVVGGTCGGTVTAALDLQDGATNLGTVLFPIQIGATLLSSPSFSAPGSITVPATDTSGPATPYPATINVSGVDATVTKVTVTLDDFSHTFPADIDVLLVGPAGQSVLLMSDVGGGTDAANVDLTFDDDAPAVGATLISGTFRPSNSDSLDTFPAPAPAAPYGNQLSAFNGVNPNGTWSLYVVDDAGADVGAIAGGWTLAITTEELDCCEQACDLTCPGNVSANNDPGQCEAQVSFALPTVSGSCGVVTTAPPSGSIFPVGTTGVQGTATRQDASTSTCNFNVDVFDVELPAGGITFPPNGACFNAPVTVLDDFTDNCPGMGRAYNPPPGPTYSTNGAHHVVLTAADTSFNSVDRSVDFTIDPTPPTVTITRPTTDQTGSPPINIPIYVEFFSSDTDGAPGVVREVVKLMNTCVLFDGNTHGDGDGLLADEGALLINKYTLCQAMARCGFTTLNYPKIRVEATDNPACTGNVGFAERIFRRRLLKTEVCAP